MKLLQLLLTVILIDCTYQICVSRPGVTTCMMETLKKNKPLLIEYYQSLLEFEQGELEIIPSGSLMGLSKIKILFINNNKIKTIELGAFDGLFDLLKLSLYNNLLETVPSGVFRDLENLKNLNLGMNRISVLPDEAFVGLTNLEEINLGFNSLSSVPESLNKIKTLKILNISNNKLKNIPPYAFHNLNKLQSLKLDSNEITDIKNKAFKGLDKLEYLYLKSNYLSKFNTQDILEDLGTIKTVSLAINSFKCNSLKEIDNALKNKGVLLIEGYLNKPVNNSYKGMICIA